MARYFYLVLALLALPCLVSAQNPPEQILQQAVALHQAGDTEGAIRQYRAYLKLRPDSPDVRSNLGAALAGTGRYAEAIVEYMVFMGIPILHQLFGPSSLFPILVANLIPTLIIIPIMSLLLEMGPQERTRSGSHAFASSLLRALRQPQVWAPIAGALLVIMKVPIPKFAIDSLQLAGQPTTGLSLFVVGLIVAEEKVRLTLAVIGDTLFKNLLHPAAMLLTVYAFGVTGPLAREAVLLAAIPSAVITTMFAEEYNILTSESSTTILATRVLSFVTIPIVLMVTKSW